jgi:hypothetical protein
MERSKETRTENDLYATSKKRTNSSLNEEKIAIVESI